MDDGDEARMAVGGDGDRERPGRARELDASRDSLDPGSGDELDAIEIVTGAEGSGRVTWSPAHRLSFTNPRREGEEY